MFSLPVVSTSRALTSSTRRWQSLLNQARFTEETSGSFEESKYKIWAQPTAEDTVSHDPAEVFAAGIRHHHTANTAYPIAHDKTLRPYRVQRVRDQRVIRETLTNAYGNLDEMMLYVHVPFCQQRCQFCEYTVVDPRNGKRDDVQESYFDALDTEFELYRDLLDTRKKKLVGFDIGGGTPSMVSASNIERVMQKVDCSFDVDSSKMTVSIETTPKIAAAEPDKIRAYYAMGIRRISMGVQTTDFALAERLGRHDADFLSAAVRNIRDAGFESFNVDLMYGFPLRPGAADKWADTVRKTISEIDPDHITLYRMRYKGTKMAHLQERVGLQQVNNQGDIAAQILREAGYEGWTGKNTYSRLPGDSGCSDYLEKRVVKGIPYIGLGLGAQSFSHSTLAYNLGGVTKRLEQYLRSVELGRLPIQDLYHLAPSGAWGKFCSVSFYFGGIDLMAFESNFGLRLEEAYPRSVQFAIDNNLMEIDEGRLQMTSIGKAHYGGVLALFYAPHIQQHLMELPGGERSATWYMGDESVDRTSQIVNDAEYSINPQRPYVGNPLPRYERKRLKRRDPRVALPADWADNTRGYSTWAGNQLNVSPRIEKGDSGMTTDKSINVISAKSKETNKPSFLFGNILFGGPCNQRCVFCIGQQLPNSLSPRNNRQWPLKNLDTFIDRMNDTLTKKVILTGTTSDPQLYKYESQLLEHLRCAIPDVHISVHTNGLLALSKLDVFNLYDTCTLSINSFNPVTFKKIHGVSTMPDVRAILEQSRTPVKLSCVLTEANVDEVEEYLATAAALGIRRVALRPELTVSKGSWRYPELSVLCDHDPIRWHSGNPVFDIDGVEVTVWTFDEVVGQSLNLFADGTLSEEYLLGSAVQTN